MPPLLLRAALPALMTLPALIALPAVASAQERPVAGVQRLSGDATDARPLPLQVGGRVAPGTDASTRYRRQWPGTYFEAAFRGPAVDMVVGPGDVSLRIAIDGAAPIALVRPAPGRYRLTAPSAGRHRVRIDVVSESQAGPTAFGGLFAPAGTTPLPAPANRPRSIEFIGDSHTVGYGNTSTTRDCTEAQVWETTNTAQGIAGQLSRRYDAAYRVNAISGRGIVRNYGGMAATTIPDAYPYALFDGQTPANDVGWQPQVIVIALGTNDFSTPLKPGERWKTRDALHADYEARYVRFVQDLRRRSPDAFFVLWATDLADGEIVREVAKVGATLRAAGEKRLAVVPVTGLAFAGCHFHPSVADDAKIAAAIGQAIDGRKDVWGR
ncbi:SGNH/GDSL hydrolase family protein [Sphingomonas sp. 2R-10]|uniref:SGNH/GDSL hydrolase family protein n=1 Tax=Sphingomonas sp. 2R-10 TaxID=3045148 RepID=UPI0019CF5E4A|nr:SGNH/GDSL hydrolase family protein [Sphingomonas sp. 2R-10]MDJ0276978.1 SGNH/GDSL hydrolase family protein [Sphingomonas sp. 2R-10]